MRSLISELLFTFSRWRQWEKDLRVYKAFLCDKIDLDTVSKRADPITALTARIVDGFLKSEEDKVEFFLLKHGYEVEARPPLYRISVLPYSIIIEVIELMRATEDNAKIGIDFSNHKDRPPDYYAENPDAILEDPIFTIRKK